MKKNLTELVFILDRSGSMSGLEADTVGGAQVSEKHAGFVINTGKATCADVLELTRQVRECVQEKTGYLLELEVRQLP